MQRAGSVQVGHRACVRERLPEGREALRVLRRGPLGSEGGTTNIGFWFLQNGGELTGKDADGCLGGDTNPAANGFSGAHVNGDLFGSRVHGGRRRLGHLAHEWDTSDAGGPLDLLFVKTALSACNVVAGAFLADMVCAGTNSETIPLFPGHTRTTGDSSGHGARGGLHGGRHRPDALYTGLGSPCPASTASWP